MRNEIPERTKGRRKKHGARRQKWEEASEED